MRLSVCGASKRRRIVCSPGLSARHPIAPTVNSADSIGCAASSDVTSTRATVSKSSQLVFADGLSRYGGEMICLRIAPIVAPSFFLPDRRSALSTCLAPLLASQQWLLLEVPERTGIAIGYSVQYPYPD